MEAIQNRNIILLTQICKRFGWLDALQGIDLQVKPGECIALLGQNGAGKTTLLKTIAALIAPTSGQVQIQGQNPRQARSAIKRQIGFAGHQTFLYGGLTAEENMRFYGRLYSLESLPERIEQVLQTVGLRHRRNDRVSTLSSGMQQRLSIARAILHAPPILLLDEPFAGLDLGFTEKLQELIAKLNANRTTILLSTHDLNLALDLCDRLVLLRNGQLQIDCAPNQLPPEQWAAYLKGTA
ncbi:MAG TPA: heme ABC exporter ATP-binding protein CcmA [bacterium]|jgi:heme exporter protein A|nr:heme ABC exporter ATP-binding protein CcmA [bacterium]HNT65920.1 heme ABC exporter ATP-binding protein CcmA [bacterium]